MPKAIGSSNPYRQDYTVGTSAPTLPSSYEFTSGGRLLWKWNELNTNEIGTRIVPCSVAPGPSNINSETITYIAPGTGTGVGPRIQFNLGFLTSSSTLNAGIWPILTSAGAPVTVPNRFVLTYRAASFTGTNVGQMFFGLGVYNGNSGSPYGVAVLQSSNASATGVVRLQASDVATTTRPYRIMTATAAGASVVGTNINSAVGAQYTFTYENDPGTVSTPCLPMAHITTRAGYAISDQAPATAIVPSRASAGAAFLTDNSSIDAGWTNQTLNYLCVYFIGATGAGANSCTFQLSDMAVFLHPLDET